MYYSNYYDAQIAVQQRQDEWQRQAKQDRLVEQSKSSRSSTRQVKRTFLLRRSKQPAYSR